MYVFEMSFDEICEAFNEMSPEDKAVAASYLAPYAVTKGACIVCLTAVFTIEEPYHYELLHSKELMLVASTFKGYLL